LIRSHPDWPAPVRKEYLETLDGKLKELFDFQASALAEAEAVQIVRAMQPADDQALSGALAEYAWTLLASGQSTNAEAPAREALLIYEKQHDEVRKFWVQSMLGESLMKQKRYAEAEPLLLSAYEGANAHKSEIPKGWEGLFFGETIDRVLNYYAATSQPEEVIKWKTKLAEFRKADAEKTATKP
jgi:tetratricopeptide (TPR) repeat protein